jgi:tRNA threonylcarbamoyladenosine modification (KEOPS) complex  Pcc1 subunit
MMKTATLSFHLTPAISGIIQKSLEPELIREGSTTRVVMKTTEEGLSLKIEADELSNLRAALNSYIRWINCINSINKVIEGN